ncbi:hypothetical protein CDLVIII_3069 [Clostridium sp. DL-VIII]|nr:AsnC family transcriptional regulator [Clostridium sp. DL-VIII]EHI99653.1 hypothetical protein CDLVIII_3069 [Clostridium sp. DL-VIII]
MLDNTDKLILTELSKNSRITMKELGERVHFLIGHYQEVN